MFSFLVVDDEPKICSSLARAMVAAGHKVECATTGEAALALADTHAFDLAIVDHHLGAWDGLRVLQYLRTRQPSCLRILLSGALDLSTVIDAVNQGKILRVMQKPFSPQDLLTVVEDALDAQASSQDIALTARSRQQSEGRAALERCLANNITLALQPIVDAHSHRPIAYEALLRSSHKTLCNPKLVIDAAEAYGMISEVADVVFRRAAACLEQMPAATRLFINLHPYELGDVKRFVARLLILQRWANRIVLEITERTKLEDVQSWREALQEAAMLGYAVAVDDLGAGYNSLSTMAELQPQFVKIDMSLVRNVHLERQKEMVVTMLCTLAHATSAAVIAEGVESELEADKLTACGADFLQGYYFGKPTTDWAALKREPVIAA